MSNNGTCGEWSDAIDFYANQLSVVAYIGMTPFYFTIGTIARGICLVTFYKQYKKEKTFAYQIYSSLSELLEVITVLLCNLTKNNLAGYRLPGALWFQQSYTLMWYAAYLASPLDQGFVTACLLISLGMAAERVLAMAKPLVYRNLNHKRIQTVVVSLCFIIGLSTSVFDMFRYAVVPNGIDKYKMVTDQVYVSSKLAMALAWLRTIVRVIANIALAFCNIAMVVFYRMNVNRKVGIATEGGGSDQRNATRKATQKTLLLLTICQSFFTTIDLMMFNTYYILVYSDPVFNACFSRVMIPICYIVMQLACILDIFALFVISSQFRNMILICLRLKKSTENTVATVTSVQPH